MMLWQLVLHMGNKTKLDPYLQVMWQEMFNNPFSGTWGSEAWFLALADTCGVKTPTMGNPATAVMAWNVELGRDAPNHLLQADSSIALLPHTNINSG